MKKPPPIAWDAADSAARSAAKVLPAMAQRLFEAGRRLAEGKPKLKRLHEFRLQVKQFRYTLELFEPLYGDGLPARLEKLRLLQQSLGQINDCVTARSLVEDAADLPGAGRVLKHIERARRRRMGRFLRFWKEEFDAPGEEKAWVRLLQEPAGLLERRAARQV